MKFSSMLASSLLLISALPGSALAAATQLIWSPAVHYTNNITRTTFGSDPGSWFTISGNSQVLPSNVYNSFTSLQRASISVKLTAGTNQYGGAGFNWNNSGAADLTNYEGVCVTYRAARAFRMGLQQNGAGDDTYGKLLGASTVFTKTYVPFSALSQEGWGPVYLNDLRYQLGIRFQYKSGINGATTDSSNTIEILQVGLGDVCDLSGVPASGAVIPSSQFWDGSTALTAQNTNGGFWKTYDDKGTASAGYSVVKPTVGNAANMETFLDSAGLVGYQATLGVSTSYPYAGISMDWRNNGSSSTKLPADISANTGICVTYRSSQASRLLLEQLDMDHTDYYGAALPAHTGYTALNLPFSAFKQEGWGYASVLDLTRQGALRIETKGTANQKVSMEILQVGYTGQCQTVTYAPIIRPKYASMTTASITEDSVITIPLDSIFFDKDDPTLTYLLTNSVSQVLTAQIVGTNLVITPKPNIDGSSQVTLKATAADGQFVTLTLDVSVANVAHPPLGKADAYTLNEDEPLVVGVALGLLINDSDADGDAFSAVATPAIAPLHGSVTINTDGSFSYTPALNYNGTDYFTYTLKDATNLTSTAKVTLTIISVNDKPIATGSIPDQGPYSEDFAGTKVITINKTNPGSGLWATFTDVETASPFIAVVSDGKIHATLSTTATTYVITLTAAPDSNGIANITLYATDAQGDTAGISFLVTIDPVADPPVAHNDTYTIAEDQTLQKTASTGLLANDVDADGDVIGLAQVVSAPTHGTLTLDPSGSFVYHPDANWFGTEVFTYKATANGDLSNVATVQIVVTSVNDNPTVVAGASIATQTVDEDFGSAILIPTAGLFTDIETPALIYSVTSNDGKVNAWIDNLGQITISSILDSNGDASLTLSASDGVANSTPATLTFHLLITPINDAPVAVADSFTEVEDKVIAKNVLSNDRDPDAGDVVQAKLVSDVQNGTLVLLDNGSFTYTPKADFFGLDTFRYVAFDGILYSDTVLVKLVVTSVNDAPVVKTVLPTVTKELGYFGFAVSLADVFTDADGDKLKITVANYDIANINVVGTDLQFFPIAGKLGKATIILTADDSHGGTVKTTFDFIVTPVALSIRNITAENSTWMDALAASKGSAVLRNIMGSEILRVQLPASPSEILSAAKANSTGMILQIGRNSWNIPSAR